MRSRLFGWLVSCLVVFLAATANAQTIAGQIAGTIRDSSGAILPGVSVTITNPETGFTRTEVTGPAGAYRVTNLPIGTYTVTAGLDGFRRSEKTGVEVGADARLTVDFALSVGGLTETIDVQAIRTDTVNRTSGEISRVIDSAQVQETALSGRNYLELASLIPGAVQLQVDQMDITTGLGTGGTVINGARGNSNNLTVDGGFNLDSGSNASMINNVGLDFIEQVAIQTSNFSAEFGRNSGAAINVVTKSGTNRFKGTAFETFRNESLDAAAFFAPVDANGKKIKGRLDFNNYGGSFGGPIRQNRLFFFGGLEFKQIDRVDGPFRRSLPTTAELRGDFSVRMGTNQLIDPVTKQPFPGNVIPQERITADGQAIASAYAAMIGRASQFDDRPVGNNATYQLDFPFEWRQEIVRIDYKINDGQSMYLRYLHDDYDLVEPRGTFIGANLPTISTRRIRPGYGYQLAHLWVGQSNFVNDLKLSASWNGQRIPPHGDAWRRDSYGFAFPQIYDGGRYDEGIPDVTVSGLASLIGPSRSLLSPTTDITVQNTLTWQRERHSLKIGVLATRNRKDQNGRAAHTGAVSFNPSGNSNSTGLALADALLGNFRTYSEAADDPIGFFRFTQYGAFVSDTWRASGRLSVEAGLRYELASPIYTQGNNVTNFDPALYDPAEAVTLLFKGAVVPGSGNPYIGLVRAGSGVPDDQQNRVAIDEAAAALIPLGAPRGLYDTYHLVMPRLSAAYSLNDNTVVRGGVGLFYDRPEGNLIYSQVNLPPFLPSISVENGNLADPLGGKPSAAAVLGGISAIDPNLEIPRQTNFSVSLQRELPGGHFAEVAYVGNRGRNLLWFPEINQASFEALAANAALPSSQRASVNFLRPYRGYSSIRQRRSEMFADYNSLQLYLNRRKGDITYSVSYTLSKATGNASGNGDNVEAGLTIADAGDDYLVGPTSYDRRHVLLTTWTYRVPWLSGRRNLAGLLLGGWEVSGKVRWQSGEFITPDGSTSIGTRRADYVGGEIDLPSGERNEERWFNTEAFAVAPNDRRGNAEKGMIEGPHLYTWDLSLQKKFPVTARVRVGLRAEIFNLFNRVNFQNPENTVTSSNFGKISSTRPPRQTQLSLRVEW
jgi:hypothetical protein